MNRLKDKVAIITGASSGMGKADAFLFAAEGAKVVIAARRTAVLEEIAEEIRAKGGEVLVVTHDVSQEDSWKNVIAVTLEKYGRIDILINNAGMLRRCDNIMEEDVENIRAVMDVNFYGQFLGIKYAAKAMVAGGHGGSIVNLSSVNAVGGWQMNAAYSAAKGAVSAISRTAAVDLAPYNIRVNCVLPGPIDTPMSIGCVDVPEINADMCKAIPMKRWGQPEEVANAVLFLASDEASYITGLDLLVDGGETRYLYMK